MKYGLVEISALQELVKMVSAGCTCASPITSAAVNKKHKEGGTAPKFDLSYSNPDCNVVSTWFSQSRIGTTKYRVGNIDLCSAILFSGCTSTRVLRVLRMMGTKACTSRTFDNIQTKFAIHSIKEYYEDMKDKTFRRLFLSEEQLRVAGDGRHHSVGMFICICPSVGTHINPFQAENLVKNTLPQPC